MAEWTGSKWDGHDRRDPDPRVAALVKACKELLVMLDSGEKPRKLDEALTWRQNDEKARQLAITALAALEESHER